MFLQEGRDAAFLSLLLYLSCFGSSQDNELHRFPTGRRKVHKPAEERLPSKSGPEDVSGKTTAPPVFPLLSTSRARAQQSALRGDHHHILTLSPQLQGELPTLRLKQIREAQRATQILIPGLTAPEDLQMMLEIPETSRT